VVSRLAFTRVKRTDFKAHPNKRDAAVGSSGVEAAVIVNIMIEQSR
jgi:hypothetical protein